MTRTELPPRDQLKGILLLMAWLVLAIFLRDRVQPPVPDTQPVTPAPTAHAPEDPPDEPR